MVYKIVSNMKNQTSIWCNPDINSKKLKSQFLFQQKSSKLQKLFYKNFENKDLKTDGRKA